MIPTKKSSSRAFLRKKRETLVCSGRRQKKEVQLGSRPPFGGQPSSARIHQAEGVEATVLGNQIPLHFETPSRGRYTTANEHATRKTIEGTPLGLWGGPRVLVSQGAKLGFFGKNAGLSLTHPNRTTSWKKSI